MPTGSIHALLFQPELVSHQVNRVAFHLVEQLVHQDCCGVTTGVRNFTRQAGILTFRVGLSTELVKLFDRSHIHIGAGRIKIARIIGYAGLLPRARIVATCLTVFIAGACSKRIGIIRRLVSATVFRFRACADATLILIVITPARQLFDTVITRNALLFLLAGRVLLLGWFITQLLTGRGLLFLLFLIARRVLLFRCLITRLLLLVRLLAG